jgi:hypothetical protein
MDQTRKLRLVIVIEVIIISFFVNFFMFNGIL